jgi:hypothetical protein
MNKSFWAKAFGWAGAAAVTLGSNGAFGKYSGFVTVLASALSALGIHHASNSDGSK